MAFDFSKAKLLVRQTVHETLAVQAFYRDSSMNAYVPVKARWHNKIDRMGDLDNQSYAELIQGIDRVIFSAEEARTLGVKRGGEIMFSGYSPSNDSGEGGDLRFTLQVREPAGGPFEEVWEVSRKEGA